MATAEDSSYAHLRQSVDRSAQRNRVLRRLDLFGLEHPVLNLVGYVVAAAFFLVVFRAVFGSWVAAVILAVVFTALVGVIAHANLRRRRRNGTSAEFGTPAPD
jgi:hypothetical protein